MMTPCDPDILVPGTYLSASGLLRGAVEPLFRSEVLWEDGARGRGR
jgi:hypothetical protein